MVAATVREKSEALDARNEFLDIASHELKTPITSLKLQLHVMQRKLEKQAELIGAEPEPEQVLALQKVDRQVTRLVKIVEQLLDVSRADRKQLVLEREDVDLQELTRSLTERLSSDLSHAKCKVDLNFSAGGKGKWDPFRLEQVMENLLSNAMKYAPGRLN